MIRDYRKRSWRGTLAAMAVLAGIAAIGLTDSPPATQGQDKEVSKQKEPKADDAKKPKDPPVRKLLDQIKEERRTDFGASILRDLVKLGPDAVPELIEELDTTLGLFPDGQVAQFAEESRGAL